ncbi:MAG: GGDEF and EAL domain-containing protein [Coriobacteriia bacterium]|nr:GGDEF and EAL domain-containing protein [Coriobacteriia bacterium]
MALKTLKEGSKLIFSQETKALRRFGVIVVVCVLFIVLVVFTVSHYTYDTSATRYFQQQSTDSLTEVSDQLVSGLADSLDAKRGILTLAAYSLNEGDFDKDGHYDDIAKSLTDANSTLGNQFDHLEALYSDGHILTSTGNEFDMSSDELIQTFLADPTPPELSVGKVAAEPKSGQRVFFVVPYPYANNDDIVGLIGSFPLSEFSKLLETNIFGAINNYVVLSRSDGAIVADSDAEQSMKRPVFEVFASFMDTEMLTEVSQDFAVGNSRTLDVAGPSTEFLLYYAPIYSGQAVDGNPYAASNLRLMVMVRADVVRQNIQSLFDESRTLLYAILALFGVALAGFVLVSIASLGRSSRLSSTDELTGLTNRKRFEKDARLLLHHNWRYAVVSMDIRHFHLLNDALGHRVADEVLAQVAHILEAAINKDTELVCRDHADLFLLLLDNTHDDIFARVKMIQTALKNCRYPGNSKFAVTWGIYKMDADGNVGIHVAIDDAIEVQGRAGKEEGDANIVFFDRKLKDKHAREGQLERRALAALENNEFVAYYQLKRGMATDEWVGAEALVRWISPEEGMISPGAFIPPFERSGFITEVDLCVFRHVCDDLQALYDAGEKMVPASVNLSKRHFVSDTFLDRYESILSSYTFPHELIEIEITESVALENDDMMHACIDFVHRMGCLCALDDFGSGDATFNMIKEFDFDIIKLDRSFFMGSNGFDDVARLIVESLIDLAHKLNKKVVAEGIEDEDQVNFLREAGCDVVQGFYFARPLPLEDTLKLLNE